jgi:hypothetical protein
VRYHILLTTALALFAGGCSVGSSGGLPTVPLSDVCPADRHVPLTIVVDRSATPAVWGVGTFGQRVALLWPEGFSLIDAGVADPAGNVVARAGQVIVDAMGGVDPSGAQVICGIDGQVYRL